MQAPDIDIVDPVYGSERSILRSLKTVAKSGELVALLPNAACDVPKIVAIASATAWF